MRYINFAAAALGASAIGAFAIGALSIGALAIRNIAAKRLVIASSKFDKVEIRELTVGRLNIESEPNFSTKRI
ncbi:MAG TPA: hypothetical protein VLH08_11335 [Acidobacteriota bacterium]|nr:hypothetical protein [Acidobacteriota bacterium]